MKIEVITMWFNEEFLAPLFLDHYRFANKIHVIVDTDTTDKSVEIASEHNNVVLHDFTFPDGMDDILKINEVNRLAGTLDCDWIIAVDADEFLFPLSGGTIEDWIIKEVKGANVIKANIWQVYKHVSDGPIDRTKKALYQRRHGDISMKYKNSLYIKPCLIKPGFGIEWRVGCHKLQPNDNTLINESMLYGTHWAMADYDLAIDRRIKGRKDRMSLSNHKNLLSKHNHKITKSKIKALCDQKENSPRLF